MYKSQDGDRKRDGAMDHTLEGLKWLNAARFQSLYEVAGGFGCRIGPNLFGCYLPAPSYRQAWSAISLAGIAALGVLLLCCADRRAGCPQR